MKAFRYRHKNNHIYIMAILLLFIHMIGFAQESHRRDSTIQNIITHLSPRIQISNAPRYYQLEERMKRYDVPGFSLATLDQGIIQSAKGYGYARQEEGVKVDQQTVFQAGSISKSLTAILVLKLQEQGMLDIDTDIDHYLKSWKMPTSQFLDQHEVTLRSLLSHTSGLKASQRLRLDQVGSAQGDTPPTLNAILNGETALQKVELDTFPGLVHRYSNQGYNLIQKIIEDITNESFETLAKRMILEPFEMHHSTFENVIPTDQNTMYAYSYRYGKPKSGYWRNMTGKCSGGLYSTPSDLGKFMIKIADIINSRDSFLSPALAAELMKGDHYGLGFDLIRTDSTTYISHSGRTSGFFAYMAIDPSTYQGFVMMTNSDDANDLFAEVLRSATHTLGWNYAKPKYIETIELPSPILSEILGDYRYQDEEEVETLSIVELDGQLMYFVKEEENPTHYPLGAISEDILIDLIDGNELKFEKKNGGIYKIIYDGEYEYLKQ